MNKKESLSIPLAESLRPKKLSEILGQDHLVGEDSPLVKIYESKNPISFLLWGPPGAGKTTIAKIFAEKKDFNFERISAVESGVKQIRECAENARKLKRLSQRTILFIDEIHHLNKSQQDILLPYAEDGTFILIGATTENPSFSLNSALLSRMRVFLLKKLKKDSLEKITKKCEKELGKRIEKQARDFLVEFSNGDARTLISIFEAGNLYAKETINLEILKKVAQEKKIRFDRASDEHYWTISAFIKSMRASDQNAAIYYLARMIEGGEDPRFIARRMVIFASEDIGLADPNALNLAVSAYLASEKIGMPEIRINLGHVCAYLCKAKKDNSAYLAIDKALAEVRKSGNLPIPLHLRNASTEFLKKLGFGKDYIYPHENKEKKGNKINLPKEIENIKFFE